MKIVHPHCEMITCSLEHLLTQALPFALAFSLPFVFAAGASFAFASGAASSVDAFGALAFAASPVALSGSGAVSSAVSLDAFVETFAAGASGSTSVSSAAHHPKKSNHLNVVHHRELPEPGSPFEILSAS